MGLEQRSTAEQAAYFKSALDCLPEIVWYKDTHNRVLWGNHAALISTGVSLEQVSGLSMEELSPRESQRYLATDRRVIETGRPVLGIEQSLREITGRRLPVRTDKYPHFDEHGQVVGIIAVSRDASMESKAEHALQMTQRRYRRLSDDSPVGVCQTDAFGNAVFVDERWCEISGLSAHESLGLGWLVAVAPGDQDVLRSDWLRVVSTGQESFRARFTVRSPVGRLQPVALQAVAARSGGEAPTGYVLTLAVIPWDEAAEDALREQRELFDTIASVAPVGIFRLDRDGGCTYVNDCGLQIMGLRWEQAIGVGWMQSVHPEDRQKLSDAVARAAESKRPVRVEYRSVSPDREQRWVIGRSVPQLDEEGEVIGHIGTAADITSRVEAQQEVQELNARLEQRVAERTTELRAANEELQAFCYCVSPDLRTPLRTLDGFSYAMIEDYSAALGEEGVARLGRIRAASQRMGRLIDDLLTMSRLNRGEIKRRRVDLSDLATHLLEEFRSGDGERVIEARVAGGLEARCDPTLIRVVLQNLFENAWKFTSKNDGATIEFGSCSVAGEERQVFFVRDDGVGFDMEFVDKLFAPFERLHDADQFEGSGIGLATVERIIKRHGGRIWAESEVGRGTTMYFSL